MRATITYLAISTVFDRFGFEHALGSSVQLINVFAQYSPQNFLSLRRCIFASALYFSKPKRNGVTRKTSYMQHLPKKKIICKK